MDLMCNERLVADNCFAGRDPALFDDLRVYNNLLTCETKFLPTLNYFTEFQKEIKPFMRKVVTVWMLEVSIEQNCENQVFPLAVNFMDRFLCVCPISRCQLQLLSTVCLLLASKIRQCNALTVDLMCYYSDHSITPHEVRSWELLVLSKLQWRMTAITGCDFVDHTLERLTWSRGNSQIRRHAHTLLSLCYTELDFMLTNSSLLASASIVAAANGLKATSTEDTLKSVCHLTGCTEEDVTRNALLIEQIISSQYASPQQLPIKHAVSVTSPITINTDTQPQPPKVLSTSSISPTSQPVTPTDIQEILF